MARVSLVPDVIDGIVAGLRAASGFRAPTSSADGITVFDGPEFIGSNDTEPDGFVVIGYGGEDLEARDDTDADDAATGEVSLAGQATSSPKDNADEIECVAWYGTGGVHVSATRLAAFAIVDAVDTWLRPNARAGVLPSSSGYVHQCQVTASSLRQYVIDGNSRAVVRFTIRVLAKT